LNLSIHALDAFALLFRQMSASELQMKWLPHLRLGMGLPADADCAEN
jgi:hypothetical protein